MKIILLFLCLLINSYCIKVTFVPIKVNTSLPTTSSEDKYFDLMNRDYYSYSSNIFILFIDNGFGLDYDNIKYCLLNNDPKIYPYIIDSCSFKKITHSYSSYSSSGIKTYGYIIPTNSSYLFSIIYYNGRYSLGSLNVICHYHYYDYNHIVMTKISEKSGISLPTKTTGRKYFYLKNNYYYSNSNYIYICFEDNSFDLDYKDIKYCYTNSSLYFELDQKNAISSCSFNYLYCYFNNKLSSNITKYYYKIPNTNFHSYTIIYYDGKNDSGSLNLTSNFYDLSKDIKMTQVSINSNKSLPISSSYNKFFYLINSEYYSYSKDIYFRLEDKYFSLNYREIKYCESYTNPGSYSNSTNIDCYFSKISLYRTSQSLSGKTKYYYRISPRFNNTYSIVYYIGSIYSSGSLYVTSDNNNLFVEITLVRIDLNESLPTRTPKKNYFYITNSNYYSKSSYAYFYFEDYNFGLNFNNIKYCYTNTSPYYYPDDAINDCSLTNLSYYDYKYYSNYKRYDYKFSINSSYTYSIFYYQGNNSSGRLYVYFYYYYNRSTPHSSPTDNVTSSVDNSETISTIAIVAIGVGSIIILVIVIIILIHCCECRKKSTIDFILVTQTNNIDQEPFFYPSSSGIRAYVQIRFYLSF